MQPSSTFVLITCAISAVFAMPQPGADNKVPGLFKRADNCRNVDLGSPCMKCSGGVCSVLRYSTGEENFVCFTERGTKERGLGEPPKDRNADKRDRFHGLTDDGCWISGRSYQKGKETDACFGGVERGVCN